MGLLASKWISNFTGVLWRNDLPKVEKVIIDPTEVMVRFNNGDFYIYKIKTERHFEDNRTVKHDQ